MFNIITEEQTNEIENLATEHFDALVAFGADLYTDGIFKGAIMATAGIATGAAIVICRRLIKNRYSKSEP